MKKLFSIISIIIVSISAHAQSDSDRITGIWLSNTKDAQIEIFEDGWKYCGKIVWLAEPNKKDGTPKTDMNNPDPELRSREIIGLEIISDLEYDDNEWVDGKFYVARKGQSVNCEVRLSDDNEELFLKISKGLFSKKVVWTRVDTEEN
jgi:uncharacterized protein (DUF2147 family)